MREETHETKRPLRTGFTTGACATAAATAAAELLLSGHSPKEININLPKGQCVRFNISSCFRSNSFVEACVIKDAGDDPDVTHKALIIVQLSLKQEPGIAFFSGEGVGTVTKHGLSLAVGEPAINPVPRQMISAHLKRSAKAFNYQGGFKVTIGVKNGKQLALKTMNARIGILGGLSILGTTGIVRPFSCAAYIASIHQSIDVALANSIHHLVACTGSSSENFAKKKLKVDESALIEMGDYVGAVLKYLKKHPVQRLTLTGGFGKISKFAGGALNLHSDKSSIDFTFLAKIADDLNAQQSLVTAIKRSNTSLQAVELAIDANIPLAQRICQIACNIAETILPATIEIDVWVLDRKGAALAHYPNTS